MLYISSRIKNLQRTLSGILIVVAIALLTACGDEAAVLSPTHPEDPLTPTPIGSITVTGGSIQGYRQTDSQQFTADFQINKQVSN